MARKQKSLQERLEERAAWGGVKLLIPAAFLPTRFKRLGSGQDMFLVVDSTQQVRIRWRNARLEEYLPLTPTQASRLLESIATQTSQYRTDLRDFSKFIMDKGEAPEAGECSLDTKWVSSKIEELGDDAPAINPKEKQKEQKKTKKAEA